MVRFNENGFVIEVETASDPIEDWLRTHDELVDLLQSEREGDVVPTRIYYLELLRAMMPDKQTARKMITP